MMMSLPSTSTPLYSASLLNGPLYLSPSRKNVVWYVGPSGQLGDRERALDGVGDVLGLDVGAVLVLQALAQGERPLGVVLVGTTEVRGHVRDELHVLRFLVVRVLRQRTGHQVREDRGRVRVVGLRRVQRGRDVGRQDRQGAALCGILGHRRRCLRVLVLEGAGLPALAGAGTHGLVAAGRTAPGATPAGSKRHQCSGCKCNGWFLHAHLGVPTSLGWSMLPTGVSFTGESWGRMRRGRRHPTG